MGQPKYSSSYPAAYWGKDPKEWPRVVCLAEGQNWRCCYCGARCDPAVGTEQHWNTASIEHLTPRAQGGREHWYNEVMACAECNNARGGSLGAMEYFCLVQAVGILRATRYMDEFHARLRRKIGKAVTTPHIALEAIKIMLRRDLALSSFLQKMEEIAE